jgi:hypothetical protein
MDDVFGKLIPDLFWLKRIGGAMEEDMWHTETTSDGLEIPASQALLVTGC